MTPDHQAAKAAIEAEETEIAALPADAAVLHRVVATILADSPAPVVASAVLGRRLVALLAADGTSVDNQRFLDLKINTVFNCGHSSLWWFHHLRGTGRVLADVGWADPREVVDFGGGVPLFAGGTADGGVIGAVAVSGLAHDADHALIIGAMRKVMAC